MQNSFPHKNKHEAVSLADDEVHVWFKEEESFDEKKALELLDETESTRYLEYKTPGKRREFLFGRMILKETLGKYLQLPAQKIGLSINPYKRPFLDGNPLFFNLSHSFGGYALIISKTYRVGVDIEYIPRKINIEDGNHVFMSKEQLSMQAKSPTEAKSEFLQRWTLKEAIYKAVDQGPKLLFNRFAIQLDPLRVDSHTNLLSSEGWNLQLHKPHSDYQLAFAIEEINNGKATIHCYQI